MEAEPAIEDTQHVSARAVASAAACLPILRFSARVLLLLLPVVPRLSFVMQVRSAGMYAYHAAFSSDGSGSREEKAEPAIEDTQHFSASAVAATAACLPILCFSARVLLLLPPLIPRGFH